MKNKKSFFHIGMVLFLVVVIGMSFAAMAANGATITKDVEDCVIENGAKGQFEVGVAEEGCSFQWYYRVPTATVFQLWKGKTDKVLTFGATSPAYKDGTQVYVEITDPNGQVTSSSIGLLSFRKDAPSVTVLTDVTDCVVEEGQSGRFEVVVAETDVSYQWYYKTPTGANFVKWEGKTSAVLTFGSTSKAYKDGTLVYVEITGSNGETVSSRTASFTFAKEVSGINIVTDIEDCEVTDGEVASYSIEATGTDLTYQWYYKTPSSSTYVKWVGKTSALLTFGSTSKAYKDGTLIMVRIKDANGETVDSQTKMLIIREDISTGIEITENPVDCEVVEGERARFEVTVGGNGNYSYQWYYKTPSAANFVEFTGKTESVLTFGSTSKAYKNGTRVKVEVEDENGETVFSTEASLIFMMETSGITIVQDVEDCEIKDGATPSFAVVAEGVGLTYQWYYKAPTASAYVKWDNKTSATLTFGKTSKAYKDGTLVYVEITDANGEVVTSKTATLTFEKQEESIVIVKDVSDCEIANGEKPQFEVVMDQEIYTYQWYYKVPGATEYKLWTGKTDRTLAFGATSPAYKDGTLVYVEITDANGESVNSSSAALIFKKTEEIIIEQDVVDCEVKAGETPRFEIKATGAVAYQWYYKVPGATEYKLWTGKTASTLTFGPTSAAYKDGTVVYVEMRDATGKTVNSAEATFTLAKIEPSIEILVDVEDLELITGEKASFSVSVANTSGVTYQWFYMVPGATEYKEWTGKTSAVLTFGNTSPAYKDGTQIYVEITDANGGKLDSSIATLTLKEKAVEPLTIVTDVVDCEVMYGETPSFTVEATGEGSLTYQWYYMVPNATEFTLWTGKTDVTLTFGTTSKAYKDGTTVKVVVSDSTGETIESSVATLTFTKIIPTVTIIASENSVVEGDSVTFTAIAENAVSYQWYVDGEVVEGANEATFTYTTENVGNVAVKCIVTSETGNTAESDVEVAVREIIPYVYFEDANTCMMQGGTLILVPTDVENAETYQWYFGTSMDNLTAVEGETSTSFSYTAESAGTVYVKCVVTSATGNTAESNIVSILVEPLMILPTVTIEASAESVQQGDAVTFTATAENAESYQWYVDGVAVEGATEATFTYITENAGTIAVKCVVTSATGNTSESMVVAIEVESLMIVPTVAIVASATSVQQGHTVTFTATAENAESYQWYVGTSISTMAAVEGATNATYTCTGTDVGALHVKCVVTSSTGTAANSNLLTVIVLEEDEVPVIPGEGQECQHDVVYIDNNDGTHTVHCNLCYQSWVESCVDSDKDDVCDHCGHSLVIDRDEDETEIIGPSSGNGNDLREPNETEIL